VINNINNISISHHDKSKVQNFPITLNISYYNYTYVKGWVIIKTKGRKRQKFSIILYITYYIIHYITLHITLYTLHYKLTN
jgi:hypothetical protein